MSFFKIQGPCKIKGQIIMPGDKSIAHRIIILSCLSGNSTTIKNFPFNEDCLSTVRAFKKLGTKITFARQNSRIRVFGVGLNGLRRPASPIFVGESGTTLRLLLGVLAGQDFKVRLTCARSLSQRPMLRVNSPLRKMGAKITCRRSWQGEEYLPATIQGQILRPIVYNMPVASAQVKSAILLAGLYAKGSTRVIEPIKTRDHTERLLKAFGAQVRIRSHEIIIKGKKELVAPGSVYVPGDISSAAFLMVLSAITSGSQVLLKNVSLNPSRLGIIRVLKRMGAQIKVTRHLPVRQAGRSQVTRFEPMGDVEVRSSRLKGTKINKKEIPSLIDELPILMVAACFARGKSRFEGVGELRVKETDRIKSMLENLRKMGADIQATTRKSSARSSEDIVINPVKVLKGARVKSFGDHRTAMSLIVAGCAARGTTTIDDTSCISKSFPDFLKVLKSITK
jgi:3-phosphoshikimate 1-carboxyvinyltransferase